MTKRRAERTDVNAEVSGALVVDNVFHLVNISDSGALIRIPQKLNLGDLYHLKFEFKEEEKTITLKLKTRVVREKLINFGKDEKNRRVPVYEVGLTFFDVTDNNIKKLKILIAQEEMKAAKMRP